MIMDYVEGEPRDVTVERFRSQGLTGDHLEMAVAQQRGEWFQDYYVEEFCPKCTDDVQTLGKVG